jgi:hypothetical protein
VLLGGSHFFLHLRAIFWNSFPIPFLAICREYEMEQGERDVGKIVVERRFKVGELVAYMEGSNVRGYRTDSGRQHGSRRIMGESFLE